MTKSIFITATGTDTGKTYVSALIVKAMRNAGLNCGYYKPALSGAEISEDGKIIPGDCAYVLKNAGINRLPENYVSYIFKPAVSPHLASEMENNPIKLKKIKSDFERIKKEFDYLLVEGAGGIVCPFNIEEGILLPDVIKALNLDTLLVADAGLGTINSTVLTAEYAKYHGINIKGIILNNYDKTDIMHRDNKFQIENLTGIKVLTEVKKNSELIDITKIEPLFKDI